MTRPGAAPALVIDDAAQHREQAWRAVDLVDDDECAVLRPEVCVSVVEPAQVSGALQVEVPRRATELGLDSPGQRGLPDLTRAEQHDGGCRPESVEDGWQESAINHCRYSNTCRSFSAIHCDPLSCQVDGGRACSVDGGGAAF